MNYTRSEIVSTSFIIYGHNLFFDKNTSSKKKEEEATPLNDLLR